MEDVKNIIVIGASAGGISAVSRMISGLSAQLDAVVLVVIHMSHKSNGEVITTILQKKTALSCRLATDGIPMESGFLYLAPPERQMMVKGNIIRVTQGTHENRYRPSIDVLFRSAAVAYGNRAVGIILTGMMDDGTSGMWAIKRTGGICIVQDTTEAEFPDMARSVLNKLEADYQLPLDGIAPTIEQINNSPLPQKMDVPFDLQIEANITENMMSDINELKKIADHSDFTCPDCGGGLWEIKNDPTHRYRCHTGHVYSENLLNELQDKNIEESLWVAVRMLEEKVNILSLMTSRENAAGNPERAVRHLMRVEDLNSHIKRLKSVLMIVVQDLNKQ
jgi:two-component system chemotaxis response regulator CheB